MLQLKTLKFNKLIVSVLIVTIMLYVRDLLGVNISSMVFAVVAIGLALPMAYDDFMCYLFFLFPIGNGLPGSYMMPVLALLWIMKRNSKLNNGAILFFVIIALFETVHFMGYNFKHESLMLVRFLSCFFLFVVCISDISGKESHNKRAFFYFFGSIVAIIGIMINTYLLGGIDAADIVRIGDMQVIDEELEGKIMLSMNPNEMAYIANSSIAILLSLFVSRFFNKRWIVVVSIIILFIAIVLSLSRTGAVVFVLTLLFFVLFKSGKRKKNTSLIIFIAIIGVFILLNNALLWESLMGRFADDTVSTAGGRSGIFAQYNQFLINNPVYLIFGTGAVYYKEVAQIFTSTHNSIQQILISYGIIGLIAFLVAAVHLYKKFKGRQFFIWVPVIVVLLNMQMIQFLMPFALLYPIVAAFEVVKGASAKYELCN